MVIDRLPVAWCLFYQRHRVILAMTSKDPLHIYATVLSRGERLAVLVDECGLPWFLPTLFITTQVRDPAKSAATFSSYLGANKRLYLRVRRKTIDLEQRMEVRPCVIRYCIPQYEIENCYAKSPRYTVPKGPIARRIASFRLESPVFGRIPADRSIAAAESYTNADHTFLIAAAGGTREESRAGPSTASWPRIHIAIALAGR